MVSDITVTWFQAFLYNTNNFHAVLWYEVLQCWQYIVIKIFEMNPTIFSPAMDKS